MLTARFYGYAYDLDSNRYIYTEVHEQRLDGDRWLGGGIRYHAPDGTLLGTKTLDFAADPFVPVYRLELRARGGYAEGVSAVGADTVEMFRQDYGARRAATARRGKRAFDTADTGFHSLLRSQFDALMAGRTARFRFLVAGNLDAFKFRVWRVGDATFEGRPAVHFRAEPDTLLRLLADTLEVVYDPAQRRLLEYRGITDIHDPATGKPYNARIAYYTTLPADAPRPLPPLNR
ncbi:MAG: hypothetical protein HYV18_07540 [Gammaproteobacteria bacterium]|nr:hypothetical protein [Gammaproteobacteria bacterium]